MKKFLSLVAAAVMALSVLSPIAATALAEEAAPAQTSATAATAETAETEAPAEETAAPVTEETESPAPESEPEQATPEEADIGDSYESVQPMKETTGVYVTLLGKSKTELKNFSVDEFLSMMTDSNGDAIAVENGCTQAEFYFEDSGRDVVNVPLNSGATIDLWPDYNYYADKEEADTAYYVRVVLGNGKQLDADNSHRYEIYVSVSTSQKVRGYIYPNIYSKNNWGSVESKYAEEDSAVFDKIGIPGKVIDCWVKGYEADKDYGLRLYNRIYAPTGITVKAYPMSEYLAYRDNGTPMSNEATGLLGGNGYCAAKMDTEITEENYATAENLWCLVYYGTDGHVLGYLGVGVVVHSVSSLDDDDMEATLWAYEADGTMTSLGTKSIYIGSNDLDYRLDLAANDEKGISTVSNGTSGVSYGFTLPEGYPEDQEYYLTMSGAETVTATLSDGTDITKEVFCNTAGNAPFGYKANFWTTNRITVTWNGKLQKNCYFSVRSGESYSSETTYFRINGAKAQDGSYLKTEAPSISSMPLDTYYSYNSSYEIEGYQVLLINQSMTADELKTLIPTFTLGYGAKAQSGSAVMTSGETSLAAFPAQAWQDLDNDGVKESVTYNVHIPGEKVQNYTVSFVSKVDGAAKLFVPGPANPDTPEEGERYVVLNEDSNDRHDIMIANVGSEPLTGLSVTLEDAQNVKLDDYWTVGGEGNDTLSGFTTVDTNYTYTDEDGTHTQNNRYATLASIAKIRLLKDGDGDVSGTLVIKSANGGERRIKLTGVAGKPKLMEANLDTAVKYVHYSYILSTNNMYKKNTVTFAVTDGALPQGVSLYEKTGEIYGVPQEAGDFTFTVTGTNSLKGFGSSQMTYTLHVADNTNENVWLASDIADGYDIQVPLGAEQGEGTYDYLVTNPKANQLFVSNGVISEFQHKTSINGKDLQTIGTELGLSASDISYESGSTRLTISGQAFGKMISAGVISTDTPNTISMEFREDGVATNEMKRTAQNFRVSLTSTSDSNSNSGSGSGSSATTASGSASQTNGAEPQYLKALRVIVTDASGARQSGLTVQLHSTVRTGVTGSDGSITFYNVEFGKHNLTVKNANGDVLATKAFTISAGVAGVTLDGVTAPGGSSMDLEVRLDGNGGMTFVATSAEGIPQTGDNFALTLCVTVLCLSGIGAAALAIRRKRQK